MINHVRTLLLNRGREGYGADFPGEEYVPTEYRARSPLSQGELKARRILFGANPDRYMLNYRLRQLMPTLHDTELVEDVLSYDSRITYWPSTDESFYKDAFVPTITTITDGSGDLTLLGSLEPDENAGKLYHWWRITLTSATTVNIKQLVAPFKTSNATVTFDSGLSSAVTLPGSSLRFVCTGPVGSAWYVQGVARPQRDMGDMLATLSANLTNSDQIDIFQPYASSNGARYLNIWHSHPHYAYKMGALLLGLAERMHERS